MPRSTFVLATADEVAMTEMMLVATANLMGTPMAMTSMGIRKTPPPVPRSAPRTPVPIPVAIMKAMLEVVV